MRLFFLPFLSVLLVLVGCASRNVAPQPSFAYPPPPGAPRVAEVRWPELLLVLKSGHVTAAHEKHTPHVWQASIDTDDGHVYRATEPRPFAIENAVPQYAPQGKGRKHIEIDFEYEDE